MGATVLGLSHQDTVRGVVPKWSKDFMEHGEMKDMTKCPFCGEQIKTKHYIKYDDWTCGCFNPSCKIRPKTVCMDTEKEAKKEWEDAFVN